MKRRIITGMVAGVAAALTLGTPAQAAVPRATVVYSSSSYITNRFSVHDQNIAILACTTVNQVRADGTGKALPYPGCTPKVEGDGGVAYSRDGVTVGQTMTLHNTMTGAPEVDSRLYLSRGGEYLESTDVGALEYSTNPDRRARYGTRSASSCVTRGLGADASYRGLLDTSLPSLAAGPDQSWYVADRDGNTIYHVDKAGKVSVLAVLPAVTITVSKALAKASGWPSCVVGTKVAFEAAPAEVEVRRDGTVYVAGQPRLRSGATATSSVIYAISPTTRKVEVLPQRYTGPVDLAVGTSGRLFVAHPHLGRISVIRKGKSSTYMRLPRVLALETDNRGRLHAVREAGADPQKTPATVVRIR
ncbi:hypothetical protein GCM10009616_08960 [Microlunatus lacustris]